MRIGVGLALWMAAATSVAMSQELDGSLDAYLIDLHEQGQFSGSVMVVRGSETLLSKGFGLADIEHGVANTARTRFKIGSITKQFTAMGILILQERGRLNVGDVLGTHLEGIPVAWRGLTMHELLTHTSGIMHSWALPGFRDTMGVTATLDDTLERYHDEPLLFDPGEGYQYSGVGYFLLAKIIEAVSGKSYETFLQDEVFAPLGMSDTGAHRPEVVTERLASGYDFEDGTLRNADFIHTPILTGGGNLYSTTEDLARWARALREGRLLSAAAYDAMYRPEREGYAYGWRVSELDGRQVLGHGGGLPGFTSFFLRIPEEELVVVVLTNARRMPVREIAETLAEAVLAHDVSSASPPGAGRPDARMRDQGGDLVRTRWRLHVEDSSGVGDAGVSSDRHGRWDARSYHGCQCWCPILHALRHEDVDRLTRCRAGTFVSSRAACVFGTLREARARAPGKRR